uniref:Major facilitator superfamily (MFS) profile domain-containing protein n=1 Tax=Octopus bimaculoides TaxID=37653 RepID=A0A0L8FTP3_OCTBM
MPFNFEKRNKVVKDMKYYQKKQVVPDGGWGWVVCFAAACTNFTVTGLATSSGIFLIGLRRIFDDPVWKLALVGALLDGLSMLAGVSLGMSFFTCQIITGLYFDKRRALAIGINNCGGGLGTMLVNLFYEFFIEIYGLRGTLLLVAGLLLNVAVYGALCRPLPYIYTDAKEKACIGELMYI